MEFCITQGIFINEVSVSIEGVTNNIYENEEEEICPICLDTLKEDLLRFKVCSHILHKECAEQCLRYNLLHCPVCRRYLYDRRANLIINV